MSEFRKTEPGKLYFVTLTVAGWIDVFTRDLYRNVIIDSLKYCQEKESLEIYAYVLMTNHLHLIMRRDSEQTLTELLGRFKSFTIKKIIKLIQDNPKESRKEWMVKMFEYYANVNNQYSDYHFWQYTNAPIELYSAEAIMQKVEYIHNNPVRAGFVIAPEFYPFSSACTDSPLVMMNL